MHFETFYSTSLLNTCKANQSKLKQMGLYFCMKHTVSNNKKVWAVDFKGHTVFSHGTFNS